MDSNRKQIWHTLEQRFRMMSFSRIKDGEEGEIPMWAYYGDHHRGVRIHFEEANLGPADGLLDVAYPDKPLINNLAAPTGGSEHRSFAGNQISTKSKAWAHEKEVRVMVDALSATTAKDLYDKERDFIGVDKDWHLRLDLGIRITPNNKEAALALKKNYSNLEIWQATKSPTAYSVLYNRIA